VAERGRPGYRAGPLVSVVFAGVLYGAAAMNRQSDPLVVCDLGATGQLVRRALATAPRPPASFREALRRQLVGGARRSPAASLGRLERDGGGGRGPRTPRPH